MPLADNAHYELGESKQRLGPPHECARCFAMAHLGDAACLRPMTMCHIMMCRRRVIGVGTDKAVPGLGESCAAVRRLCVYSLLLFDTMRDGLSQTCGWLNRALDVRASAHGGP